MKKKSLIIAAALLAGSAFLFCCTSTRTSSSNSGRKQTSEFQPESVSQEEADSDKEFEGDSSVFRGQTYSHGAITLQQGSGDPIKVVKTSMVTEGKEDSNNPVLVRYGSDGSIVGIRRLMVINGTFDEVRKRQEAASVDIATLNSFAATVEKKKLDIRKPSDRDLLVQFVQSFGSEKAQGVRINIYDSDFKQRYRWPRKSE